ncbi:MAG: HAMP domain-containing protein [Candidatus Binataceae bacterium]|nr:HAMP domain-containing protein [Candidatus Binataceae bacterium]
MRNKRERYNRLERAQRMAEGKRRRRELIAVGLTIVTLLAFVLAQTRLPQFTRHTSLLSNLVVILLFDLSFLLLALLLFLVGRNLTKAIFERRRGLVGSRLQFRLVFGFIVVAMVPTLFLLYVAGSFLHNNVDSWFNPQYEHVLEDSLEIAKVYYLNSANNAARFARVLSEQISAHGLLDPAKRPELKRFITKRQQEYSLGTVEVFSRKRRLLVLALSSRMPTGIGVSPYSPLLTGTLAGHSMTRTDRFGDSDVIRGSAPIYASPDSDLVEGALVVDYYLPQSISDRAAGISRTFQDYLQLRILQQPIFHSYVLALVLIGLVVVMLASWFGLYLARGITGPIRMLAEGTHAIATGDLNYRIPLVGDDEIAHLVESFNQMTTDIRASRAELDRRRQYTETLLRNVSAGVAALDPDGHIATINPCAARMLGLAAAEVLGQHYSTGFPASLAKALDEIFLGNQRPHEARSSVKFDEEGRDAELMLTATTLGGAEGADGSGGDLGTVLFFEDVSQIAKVERMEAWREVARRIAHEIKNPLTPIQLSAERLRRQISPRSESEATLLEECTRAITSEVEDLKHLVNEFSAFARMPHLNPVPGHLNALAEDIFQRFREANPGIECELELAPSIPMIAIDREALRRAIFNVLDNAAAAAGSINHNGAAARVALYTRLDTASGVVMLEVADNGPGIDPRLRTRIFEPYFSTKKSGTGLGLAIVSAIVSDHHGFVRVRDNHPRGCRFILEFPVKEQQFVKQPA